MKGKEIMDKILRKINDGRIANEKIISEIYNKNNIYKVKGDIAERRKTYHVKTANRYAVLDEEMTEINDGVDMELESKDEHEDDYEEDMASQDKNNRR